MSQFAHEYFPNWLGDVQTEPQVLGDFRENNLPEPDLDAQDLTAEEWREALRSCKGMTLRQEVYELDVDELTKGRHKPVKLFTTAYHNCHIHRVQPRAGNKHAVFHVTESEAITYHYELDLRPKTLSPDPRVAHTLNLKIDEYGNIQQSVSVVYPRIGEFTDATLMSDAISLIQHVQRELHLAYTETRYTNDVIEPESYRLRLPCEVLTYELTGFTTKDAGDAQTPDVIDDRYFTLDELRAFKLSDRYQSTGTAIEEIAYHLLPNSTSPQKRLVEHARTLFFDQGLDKPLSFKKLNALALPYESYTLALTGTILDLVFDDKIKPEVQDALPDKKTSGYLSGVDLAASFKKTNGDPSGAELDSDTTGQYWMCSGVAGFSPDAVQHFYLPERYTDPFGNPTTLNHDPRDLYIQSSEDALGNRTEVIEFDFRVLSPCKLKDINDNVSEVRFDVLGMPTAMAVMGKGNEGDNLAGFDDAALNPDLATLTHFFVTDAYSAAQAKTLLGNASARHVYYFGEVIQGGKTVWGQHPACSCGIVREQHAAVQPDSPVQTAFEYSDGAGNLLVKKVQAEPEQRGGPLRWVASGKTILNNKGKPVKQYKPYFSSPAVEHHFEEPAEVGVTPVLYYDAVGRLIRTESPDGSYSRVEFSPWHVANYDANDTVKEAGNAWFGRTSAPNAAKEDQRAARLVAEHADTPSVMLLDTLGREVITIAHNRTGPAKAPVDGKYLTFTKLDAEGKPLWVQDARGNRVMQYVTPPLPDGAHPFDDSNNLKPHGFAPCYDIAGNLLFQHSMDAGDRWMLNDAAGKPMFAWNSRGFMTRVAYDALHRPTDSFVTGADPQNPGGRILFERMVYGESQPQAAQHNLRGKLYQQYDGAGRLTHEGYDFMGNLLSSTRQLTVDYTSMPDWSQTPALETETFVSHTRYDALGRPVQVIAPHSTTAKLPHVNVIQPTYNEAGLLERVDAWLNRNVEPNQLLERASADQHIVTNINYNAKGQRELIRYGNGSDTSYTYEPDTFRLKCLTTTRKRDSALLQNLNYTYDPVGNIIQIRDDAQDRVFHINQCVLPGAEYRYDALYRLVAASGREHKGDGQQYGWDDSPRYAPSLPNDCHALQNYVEIYHYDPVGNIMQMLHHAGRDLEQPGQVSWNRRYQYALDSNRLLATSAPDNPNDLPDYVAQPGYGARYAYDPHGNMTSMPHLAQMDWDFQDQLHQVDLGGGGKAYYVYDAGGQRVRKVIERQNGTRQKERIYLGGFEIYREYNGDGKNITLERETLHIIDGEQRIALVETKTIAAQSPISNAAQSPISNLRSLPRYHLGNHLGSVVLELGGQAQVISYEEYTPYGSTAYQAGRSAAEVSLKRYRYTGKERDEESGLAYHGARYYAAWLGRWVSCDPVSIADGPNLYRFVHNNPTRYIDPLGKQTLLPEEELAQQCIPELHNVRRQENYIAPYNAHEKYLFKNEGLIKEHPVPGAIHRAEGTNPLTGEFDFTHRQYLESPTFLNPSNRAHQKTYYSTTDPASGKVTLSDQGYIREYKLKQQQCFRGEGVSISPGELCRTTEKNITTANLWHDMVVHAYQPQGDGYGTCHSTINLAC